MGGCMPPMSLVRVFAPNMRCRYSSKCELLSEHFDKMGSSVPRLFRHCGVDFLWLRPKGSKTRSRFANLDHPGDARRFYAYAERLAVRYVMLHHADGLFL